jgi:hypothetical protein
MASDTGRQDYVTDTEIARRLRHAAPQTAAAIRALSQNPRFPRPDPLFNNKRYWPAIVQFLMNRAGALTAEEAPKHEPTERPPEDRFRAGARLETAPRRLVSNMDRASRLR